MNNKRNWLPGYFLREDGGTTSLFKVVAVAAALGIAADFVYIVYVTRAFRLEYDILSMPTYIGAVCVALIGIAAFLLFREGEALFGIMTVVLAAVALLIMFVFRDHLMVLLDKFFGEVGFITSSDTWDFSIKSPETQKNL